MKLSSINRNQLPNEYFKSKIGNLTAIVNGSGINFFPPQRERSLVQNTKKTWGVKYIDGIFNYKQITETTPYFDFYLNIEQYVIQSDYNNIGLSFTITDSDGDEKCIEHNGWVLIDISARMLAIWGIFAGYREDWNETHPILNVYNKIEGRKSITHCLKEGEMKVFDVGINGVMEALNEFIKLPS